MDLKYFVEFAGPARSITVDMTASGKTSATDPSTEFGELILGVVGFSPALNSVINPGSISITDQYIMQANQPYEVEMTVEADVGNSSAGMATAYLDPYFYIDPSSKMR